MAKFTSNTPLDMTNDTTFRAWTQELDGAITGCGAAHSADTGQVDLTTVTRPAGSSTSAGYKIYELFSGAVYLKLEFGTYSPAASAYQIWVTIGTSTDGAGDITGTAISRNGWTGTHTTSNFNSYVCYDASHCLVIGYKCGISSTNDCFDLVIARTVDSAGSPTAEGVLICVSGRGGYLSTGSFSITSGEVNNPNSLYASCFLPFYTSATDGGEGLGNTYVYPQFAALPHIVPTIGSVVALSSEAPVNSTFTTTVMGTSRTFVATSRGYANGSGSNVSTRLCILYED